MNQSFCHKEAFSIRLAQDLPARIAKAILVFVTSALFRAAELSMPILPSAIVQEFHPVVEGDL